MTSDGIPKTGCLIFFSPFSIRINIRQDESLCFQLRSSWAKRAGSPIPCPEGLILYFTIVLAFLILPLVIRFNAPKGLFCISPSIEQIRFIDSSYLVFQYPKGLILYFTYFQVTSLEPINIGFNAPKGLFCISPMFGEELSAENVVCFNAPKGLFCISPWVSILYLVLIYLGFNAPKGLFCISPLSWYF